jgi:hypothetical protein
VGCTAENFTLHHSDMYTFSRRQTFCGVTRWASTNNNQTLIEIHMVKATCDVWGR